MSTIKWRFNIWTVMMFLWCLALAIVITQPILAKADNEWNSEVVADTTFSDAKSMSLDTLNVSNSINVWNVDFSDWKFCNQDGLCISLEWDKISVNKINIWWSRDSILISGNKMYYEDEQWTPMDFKLNGIDDFVNETEFKNLLDIYGLIRNSDEWNTVEPARKERWWVNHISFNDGSYSNDYCTESHNAWTLHYIERSNWSQLIMCMKISNASYSGVVLKEFSNVMDLEENKP